MKGNFDEIINADRPVLIDFFAEWCGPCKMMPPILKQVKEHFGEQVRILKIDTDKHPDISARYQIRSVPTLILFQKGAEKWRQAGVPPVDHIVSNVTSFV